MAAPVRSRSWQPMEVAEVIGPGTAITTLPSAAAVVAVLRAPLRTPASTTTVAVDSAAISRLRTRNRCLAAWVPGGYSLSTSPVSAIRSSSEAWPEG